MPKRDVLAPPEAGRRCARTLPASADQVGEARRWLRAALGADQPCADDAQLVISELVTNAIQHGSRSTTSLIRVVVRPAPYGSVFVSVTDGGRDDVRTPGLTRAGLGAIRGRGLALVDQLAIRWGALRAGTGHCVYALVGAPIPLPRKDQRTMTIPAKPMPKAFMLVGDGGPHILDRPWDAADDHRR